MTKQSLKKIIKERMLSEPTAVMKYTGGRCKTPSGKFESKMRMTVYQHALSQTMMLIFFLDRAKMNLELKLGRLFKKSSSTKSSEEVLISLVQDCFSQQRSTIMHLKYEGISVSHVQTPLDDYDFFVKNLAVDLKDGVCLAKMIDAVTSKPILLSSMQLPTATRQRKTFNVNLALSYLRQLGVPNISDITTTHIVDAHQPRIIQLLWSSILHFELPEFRPEIIQHRASRIIQGHARKFLGMRSYQLARDGTILFQSLYRGFTVRSTMCRRICASTLIQKTWRLHYAKMVYELDLMRIITVQSMSRRFITRNLVDRMASIMNHASTEIQRTWRGYSAKFSYGCDMMDIITVQSICRRFISRNQVDELARSMKSASIEIQRIWRGYHAKIIYGCAINDIIAVQSIYRRLLACKEVASLSKETRKASIDIQRIWRGYNAKLCYGFDLIDIITVQSICRQFIARNTVARLNACTRKVQSTVRMWAARKCYYNCLRAICKIQGRSRVIRASSHVCYLITQIVHLQRLCRGWLCRKQLVTLSTKIAEVAKPILDGEEEDKAVLVVGEVATVAGTSSGHVSLNKTVSSLPGSSSQGAPPLQVDDIEIFVSTKHARRKVVTAKNEVIASDAILRNMPVTHSSPRLLNPSLGCSSSHEVSVSQSNGGEISFSTRHARRKTVKEVGVVAIRSVLDTDAPPSGLCSPFHYCSSLEKDPVLHIDSKEKFFRTNQARRRRGSCADEVELIESDALFFDKIKDTTSERSQEKVHRVEPNIFSNTGMSSMCIAPSLFLIQEEVASVLIQKAWRHFILSKLFVLKKRAAIVCQAFWRRLSAKREVTKQLMRNASATKISSAYRSHAEQGKFRLILASIIIIQKYHRGYSARAIDKENKILKNLEKDRNAAIIQTYFRRYCCLSRYTILTVGILSLQSQTRGWISRTQAKLHWDRREHAAATMQKIFRGSSAFEKFTVIKFAAIIIQSSFRRHLAVHNYSSLRKSALYVQALYRRRQAMQETAHFRVIQRAVRRFVAKMRLRQSILSSSISLQRRQYLAAIQLQRMWRGYRKNVDFILLIFATIKIQSFSRSRIAVIKYCHIRNGVIHAQATFRAKKAKEGIATRQQMKHASTEFQRIWRGFYAKVNYEYDMMNIITVQSAGRRFLAKREVKRMAAAVSTIQRAVRNYMVTSMRIKVECFAATEIQRIFRGYRTNLGIMLHAVSAIAIQAVARGVRTRSDVVIHRNSILSAQRAVKDFSAVEIQRTWRGYRVKKDFVLTIKSVIKIQATARGRQVRQDTIAQCESIESFAASEIQRYWRGYREHVNFMLIVLSAIKIQSFARSIMATVTKLRNGVMEKRSSFADQQRQQTENNDSWHDESIRLFDIKNSTESMIRDEASGLMVQESTNPLPNTQVETISFNLQNSVATRHAIAHALSKSFHAEPPNEVTVPSPCVYLNHSSKFERHTVKAVKTVMKSKELNNVIKAVMNLEKITEQSQEDCELIVKAEAHHKMLSIIRSCNRSSPHLELVRAILSVLENLVQHAPILSQLANEKALDILTDSVQMFRDKPVIFAQSSSLLEKFLRSSDCLMTKYYTPENKKRLYGILLLCKKKSSEIDVIMNKGIFSLENAILAANVSCT